MTRFTPLQAAVGDQLPAVSFGPITRAQLALYAGASGDHNPIHIDSDMATAAGMPAGCAPGWRACGGLARAPGAWAGAERLRSFGARFVSMTHVHDLITCTGRVVDTFEEGGERRARIEVTASAQDGRKTLTGTAVVALD